MAAKSTSTRRSTRRPDSLLFGGELDGYQEKQQLHEGAQILTITDVKVGMTKRMDKQLITLTLEKDGGAYWPVKFYQTVPTSTSEPSFYYFTFFAKAINANESFLTKLLRGTPAETSKAAKSLVGKQVTAVVEHTIVDVEPHEFGALFGEHADNQPSTRTYANVTISEILRTSASRSFLSRASRKVSSSTETSK